MSWQIVFSFYEVINKIKKKNFCTNQVIKSSQCWGKLKHLWSPGALENRETEETLPLNPGGKVGDLSAFGY